MGTQPGRPSPEFVVCQEQVGPSAGLQCGVNSLPLPSKINKAGSAGNRGFPPRQSPSGGWAWSPLLLCEAAGTDVALMSVPLWPRGGGSKPPVVAQIGQLDVGVHRTCVQGGWRDSLGPEVMDPGPVVISSPKAFIAMAPGPWESMQTAQGRQHPALPVPCSLGPDLSLQEPPRASVTLRGAAQGQAGVGAQEATLSYFA